METNERDRIESLASHDSELRNLWDQHLGLKAKIEKLNARAHLTPEEQIEYKKLQKLKLAAKDQIAAILSRHE